MSLRSNATPSGNAQRINDTAGMGLHMCLCSSWHSYATRGMTDTGSQRCEAGVVSVCDNPTPNYFMLLRAANQRGFCSRWSCPGRTWAAEVPRPHSPSALPYTCVRRQRCQ
jgi:hypothetical protein